MKYAVNCLAGEGFALAVFRPDTSERLPVFFLNAARAQDWDDYLPRLASSMGKTVRPAMLACVQPTDWDRDFSPWPAEGLRPGQPAFAGLAAQRVRLLADAALPLVMQAYPTLPGREHTGVVGYSLGGLAALYALYERPDVFGHAGCLSGSLWYQGFMDYQRARLCRLDGARVYLSLGRKEERTRHPLLCQIGACYQQTHALLAARLGPENVAFALHDGGHGTEVPRRMLAGFEWLLGTAFTQTSLS